VRVRLLLQGKIEYALVSYASRALYGALLDGGIEIHEYHRSLLHAKVAVFDERYASVGSSNIDPLSLLLAREANIFVDDAAFAAQTLQEPRGGDADRRRAAGAAPLGASNRLLTRLRMWLDYGIARFADQPVRPGSAITDEPHPPVFQGGNDRQAVDAGRRIRLRAATRA